LDEVQHQIRGGAPFDPPTIVVGPGRYLLRRGVLLINQSGVRIIGTVEKDGKGKILQKTQLVGRVRVESGASNISLEDMQISNPRGAGIYCTGKNTEVLVKNCKVSGCRGNAIFGEYSTPIL